MSAKSITTTLILGAGAAVAVVVGMALARLSFGPPLVLLGLGGMTLSLTGLLLYRLLAPLFVAAEKARAEAPAPAVARRELERDKQAVLRAIREIEHDYQMRKLSETDYRDMLDRARTRAMRIIRELDAGDDYRTLIEEELKARLAGADGPRGKGPSAGPSRES